MFVMLFIYVSPFNYSFVYLFMGELTEIGKFIFAEGHLAPLCSLLHSTKGTSRSLLIALRAVPLNSHAPRQADGSAGRKVKTGGEGRKTQRWQPTSSFVALPRPRSPAAVVFWGAG